MSAYRSMALFTSCSLRITCPFILSAVSAAPAAISSALTGSVPTVSAVVVAYAVTVRIGESAALTGSVPTVLAVIVAYAITVRVDESAALTGSVPTVLTVIVAYAVTVRIDKKPAPAGVDYTAFAIRAVIVAYAVAVYIDESSALSGSRARRQCAGGADRQGQQGRCQARQNFFHTDSLFHNFLTAVSGFLNPIRAKRKNPFKLFKKTFQKIWELCETGP